MEISRSERDSLVRYIRGQEDVAEGYELEVDGERAQIMDFLGEGGSKEVYDADITDDRRALAMPKTGKRTEIALEEWRKALEEPWMTDRVRGLGIPTNDMCEIRAADFGEYEIPVLVMKRYEDHEFEIYDANNPHGSHRFLEGRETPKQLTELISPLADDVATLVENGVVLGADCFNICEIEAEPRLYMNDMGSGSIREEAVDQWKPDYVRYAISAFVDTAYPTDVDGTGLDHISDTREKVEGNLEDIVSQNLDG